MKEAPHLSCEESMFTRSQERLLRYLGGFPQALEQAWDVPREVSLPGLSEAMGVVRSGLNQPLTGLLDDGYISVRIAHVIGGGSRRRQVYHITEKGRAWLEEHPAAASAGLTTETERPSLVGRQEALSDLKRLLNEHRRAVVGGLSGIGKTAMLRVFATMAQSEYQAVHWADADEFTDAEGVLAAWFPNLSGRPSDEEAMVDWTLEQGENTLFVLDDIHRLSPRHFDTVLTYLNALHERGQHLVVAGRLPLVEGFDWPLLRLSNLEPKEAIHLLGAHLEEATRLDIAKALGGHPMALHLYQEGAPLPEAGADIQAFVEETMLSELGEDEQSALDAMVLFPRPLPADVAPGTDWVGSLDDRALLRWSANSSAFEVQHLVRNVRRTMLSETQLRQLHEDALTHWAQHAEHPAFAVLKLYHAMALESEEVDSMMDGHFDRLMASESSALAVLFDRATQERPDEERLHYWASRVALQRHELDHARHHLAHIESEAMKDELGHHLALLVGDEDEAQRLLDRQLQQAASLERARMLLRAAVQRIDDRLFDEAQPVDVAAIHALLDAVTLPEEAALRSSIMVSMSMIQHTIALTEDDEGRAADLVEGLEAISSPTDPVVLALRAKASIHAAGTSSTPSQQDLEAIVHQAMDAQPTPFHRAVIGLTYAEHLVKTSQNANEVVADLPAPDAFEVTGAPVQRYAGRWWYLQGHLQPDRAAMALRESARCFRAAGCLNASKAVARRLHRLL